MANSTPVFTRSGKAAAHRDLEGVTLCDLGTVDSDLTIDCSKAKLFYAASITGTITVDFDNVPVGDEVIVDLKSHATPPTATFTGVDVWMTASAPTWAASKTTRIRLLNNGHQVVGSFLEEYHA